MKLTKAEISRVKNFWGIIQSFFASREECKENYIKYGWLAGCIHQIIHGHIYFADKDLEKNNNSDEYLTEQFGKDFMDWLCGGHRLYAYNKTTNDAMKDVITYETSQESKDRQLREMAQDLIK